MAATGRVTVLPADIVGNNGSVYEGLLLWSQKHDPATYNEFQSVFYSLLRDHKLVDLEAAAGETQSERQVRMHSYYQQIMMDVHP